MSENESAQTPDAGVSSDNAEASPSDASTSSAPETLALEEKVRESLKQVIDPELYVNIVDLGLIYVIAFEDAEEGEGKVANIEMTMTSPMCPAGPQLVSGAKNAAEQVEGVETAEVKVVMDPPWSPDRMTEEARDHLGIF